MEHLKKEYNDLLLSGRYLPEDIFDKKIDEFLLGKTEDEKEYVRLYMLEVFKSKVNTIKLVSDEISMLKQGRQIGFKKQCAFFAHCKFRH